MVRTQIQLTDDQYRRLKALARTRDVSLSHLVREGVAYVISAAERRERWRALMGVVGKFEDEQGRTDIAAKHDEVLGEIYGRDLDLR